MQNQVDVRLNHIPDLKGFGKDITTLLKTSGVITARDTHYESKEEREEVMKKVHFDVFSKDRGVYALCNMIAGTTDYAKQKAVRVLLSNSHIKYPNSILPYNMEMMAVNYLINATPINRILNTFIEMKVERVNNTRLKKRVIIPTILHAKNLSFWSVKYRKKIAKSLEHAWGRRVASIVKSICLKKYKGQRLDRKEKAIFYNAVGQYIRKEDEKYISGCISFVLGNTSEEYDVSIFKEFNDAKGNLSAGFKLPKEVLEGIRGMYHKGIPKEEIIKLTKDTSMTEKQKRLVQKKAKEADIEVEINPSRWNLSEIFIYGFEMGMDRELWSAAKDKARVLAKTLPISFENIGIVVDYSFSMTGSEEQKLRPAAISLATALVLRYAAKKTSIRGVGFLNRLELPKPGGATSLAMDVVELAEEGYDNIFILSDGYENSPAGRLDEVAKILKRFNVNIYHINPVSGSGAVRQFGESIPVHASSSPESLGIGMFLPMFEIDCKKAIEGLIKTTLPLLEGGGRK